MFAGDLLKCDGDDLGPCGEKAALCGPCVMEKGVDTGGVPTAPYCCADAPGVLPCCEGACFMGVGVAMARFSDAQRCAHGQECGGRVVDT